MASNLLINAEIAATPARIIRLPEVLSRTGLRRSSLYERIKDKSFPEAISLGGRSVGWLESDVTAWIMERVDRARQSSV